MSEELEHVREQAMAMGDALIWATEALAKAMAYGTSGARNPHPCRVHYWREAAEARSDYECEVVEAVEALIRWVQSRKTDVSDEAAESHEGLAPLGDKTQFLEQELLRSSDLEQNRKALEKAAKHIRKAREVLNRLGWWCTLGPTIDQLGLAQYELTLVRENMERESTRS